MFKSAVFQGSNPIGEVEIYPQNSNTGPWMREIRISHYSSPSDRSPPLAVLHTIAGGGVCFKMESRLLPSNELPLFSMHAACLRENKTAVVLLGEEELHLVAMPSRRNLMRYSCFWGFIIPKGLYTSCLVMLNMRCLGIVFDLDETLIVANTMRSFEDRINALQRKISIETDPQRVAGMLSEVKRYQDDKSILKQYVDNDQVVDNGKVLTVQSEIVPPLSDNHQVITRPIIRLQEKNIILTRVNPGIRDTSVLVRLRPAWEDLRNYLTAKGRKRFEVYVCTMAERDYALEMWRLLDPESCLINPKEFLDRIVCVESGSRKSLISVFRDGICHPRMALVIDDRLKVWDEKDQPRVHVVPAFAPYYAPQAEANSSIPVLCVARNVACNVRGVFFREFDEALLPRLSNVFFEDEITDFPSAPDVGNCLISEDDNCVSNGNKDPLGFEGMIDAEVDRRLKDANYSIQAAPSMVNGLDLRALASVQQAMSSSGAISLPAAQMMVPLPNTQCSQVVTLGKPLGQSGFPEPTLQGSPAREEGEVPESELDPDTRRRLLILQHGQDTRDPPAPPPLPPPPPPLPFQVGPPLQISVPPVHRGSWYPLEEEISPRQLNRAPKEFHLEPEAGHNKKRPRHPSFFRGGDHSFASDRVLHESKRLSLQVHHGGDNLRSNQAVLKCDEMAISRTSANHRDGRVVSDSPTAQHPETPAGILREIAMKCGTKVEFRSAVCDTTELQFSFEVWFVGEKIGEGIGRSRKEAQHKASEASLKNLANKYVSFSLPDPAVHGDPIISASEESQYLEQKLEGSKNLSSVAALKELCTTEGFNLVFQAQPSIPVGSAAKGEVHAQVEVAGQILGKGDGINWEEAKLQAAEEALGTLQSMLGQFTQKHSGSPRSWISTTNKRLKVEYSRALQRTPSNRYSKNDTPVL